MMRTTLTIDDDVAAQLEAQRRRGRASLKEVVNEALRRGLKEMDARGKAARPVYRTPTFDLGPPRVASLDNIAEVLAIAEGEDFR